MNKSKYLIMPLMALTGAVGVVALAQDIKKEAENPPVKVTPAELNSTPKGQDSIPQQQEIKEIPDLKGEETAAGEEVVEMTLDEFAAQGVKTVDSTKNVKEAPEISLDEFASQSVKTDESKAEAEASKVTPEDNSKALFAKGDSIITNCLLLPLEEKYVSGKIARHINDINNTPEEWKSPDFREAYNDYMPLLTKYGEYSKQLAVIVDRLIEIVTGIDNDPARKPGAAKHYLDLFVKGSIAPKGNPKRPYKFDYLAIYNNKNAANIYYLDDRIDEVKKALNGYSNFLMKSGKSADRMDGQATLRALKDIRKMLPGGDEKGSSIVTFPKQKTENVDDILIEDKETDVIPNPAPQQKEQQPVIEEETEQEEVELEETEPDEKEAITNPVKERINNAQVVRPVNEETKVEEPAAQTQPTGKKGPNKKVAKNPQAQKPIPTQSDIDRRIAKLKDDFERVKAQRAELQKELDKYEEDPELYKEDIVDLRSRIRNMSKQIDGIRKVISGLEADKSKLPGGSNPMRK